MKIDYMEWTTYFKILLLVLIVSITSCTVKIPDIKITGEKTALENQVLGEYSKIKEDAWMVASERGDGQIKITADRKEVVEAVRDREFLKDDMNELKLKGYLGEIVSGLLEVIDPEKILKLDKKEQNRIELLLKKENNARILIMKRIIETDTKFKSSPKEVYQAFFVMNLEDSPEKTFYQNKKGKWVKK
ncbi:MAG: DUF1318 domain-containing protein [Candidatus Delongbacteria bacterium]|nr:DUF1318 domain-containing protein [Candidatus Delongbacteria bacterium]